MPIKTLIRRIGLGQIASGGKMLRIRFERLRRAWTQTMLAYKTGLSASDISKIENGIQRPYPKQARALSKALRVPTGCLLDEMESSAVGCVLLRKIQPTNAQCEENPSAARTR